jgi:uncharacterized protein (TIGR03083 family)
MQLAPRYDGPAVVQFDDVGGDPSEPLVRQRSRLADLLAELGPHEWAAPSRCDGWTVQDVIAHLVGVNRYWSLSIAEGLKGTPTRLLTSFDPVTVPAAMVEKVRGTTYSATLDEFRATNDHLASLLAPLGAAEWSAVAEAPPGHVSIRVVAAHALWDAWIHERDVVVPLQREQTLEADEIGLSLAYAVALGPAYGACAHPSTRTGVLGVVAHEPDLELVVEIGEVVRVRRGLDPRADATIEGSAVELVEGLSLRGPAPRIGGEHRWLLSGLDDAFDAKTPTPPQI